jgi:hypothetical protein
VPWPPSASTCPRRPAGRSPPPVDEHGLADAIEEQAARLRRADLQVEVDLETP